MPPRSPARSTKAANSAIRSRMRSAPRSTTPTSSSRVSSVTARPRPVRSRRAGTRTSSSIPCATAQCCRSCTSTGTRSRTPRCSRASARTSSRGSSKGTGGRPTSSPATSLRSSTSSWPPRSTARSAEIRRLQRAARESGDGTRPRWPMIVLRTPKGWTGPAFVDGLPVEGTWRAHQVPLAAVRTNPDHLAMLEAWMRSYRPGELFDDDGVPHPFVIDWMPKGAQRMCANPHANGGILLRDLDLPDFRDYAVEIERNGATEAEATRRLGRFLRDVFRANARVPELPTLRSGRDRVQPARRGVRGNRQGVAGRDPAGGRASVAARPRDGDPQRAHVRRLARGLPAHRPARLLQLLRSVHAHHRFDVQPAREVARDRRGSSSGGAASRR